MDIVRQICYIIYIVKTNKTSKLAIRLEPREKDLLNYFATRLGMSPSVLVRNQIKSLLKDLEEAVENKYYVNIAKISAISGPEYSQEDIESLFEISQK